MNYIFCASSLMLAAPREAWLGPLDFSLPSVLRIWPHSMSCSSRLFPARSTCPPCFYPYCRSHLHSHVGPTSSSSSSSALMLRGRNLGIYSPVLRALQRRASAIQAASSHAAGTAAGEATGSVARQTLEQLEWSERFTAELPADTNRENSLREV